MNCPYCGSPKAAPIEKGSHVYSCPVCEYRFEPSILAIFLDKYFSFHFASFVLTGIIVGLNFLFSYFTRPENRSLISYFVLNLLMTDFILIIIYFATTNRRLSIILRKRHNLIWKIRYSSPLVKVIFLLLLLILILAPFS